MGTAPLNPMHQSSLERKPFYSSAPVKVPERPGSGFQTNSLKKGAWRPSEQARFPEFLFQVMGMYAPSAAPASFIPWLFRAGSVKSSRCGAPSGLSSNRCWKSLFQAVMLFPAWSGEHETRACPGVVGYAADLARTFSLRSFSLAD